MTVRISKSVPFYAPWEWREVVSRVLMFLPLSQERHERFHRFFFRESRVASRESSLLFVYFILERFFEEHSFNMSRRASRRKATDSAHSHEHRQRRAAVDRKSKAVSNPSMFCDDCQSLDTVDIDLRSFTFTHGQSYVPLSRFTDVSRLCVHFPEQRDGKTTYVVYPEVLLRAPTD